MAYTPNPDRKVKDGKAVVSAKELADFKSQYGEDKSLRDLLNADKGLRRRSENSAPAKKADPVKEAAPAKSSVMPDTDRDLSEKVKEEEKPFSEYRFGPQNIKRNLLNAPSDISDLVSSPFRAIREAGSRGNPDVSKKMASGGKVSSASKRADGIAQKGKTRGKMC